MKFLIMVALIALTLEGHSKKNETRPWSSIIGDLFGDISLDISKNDIMDITKIFSPSNQNAFPSTFAVIKDVMDIGARIIVNVKGDDNIIAVKLTLDDRMSYYIVIDLNENAIIIKMGDDMCYSFSLPSMYRVGSIKTLISTWNMFASKVSDNEYLFPSFLPEEMRIKLQFKNKELHRIVYKPFDMDMDVLPMTHKEYPKFAIQLQEITCKSANATQNSEEMFERLQDFILDNITP